MGKDTDQVYEFDTAYGHYAVIDMIYEGRPARVLFSGDRQAAQSGIATDGKSELLFDYNQRMFELVVGLHPERILLIGGGMFTLPTALLKALPEAIIDVVELDGELAKVAAKYFGLEENSRLTIINSDGLTYLSTTKKRYDMILLDAYTHASAEPTLESPEAILKLRRHLMPDGVIVSNIIAAYLGRRSVRLRQLMYDYEQQFTAVKLFPASSGLSQWLPQNLILTAQLDADTPINEHIRLGILEPALQPFDLSRDLAP